MSENNPQKQVSFLKQSNKIPLWSRTVNPLLTEQAVFGTFHLLSKKNQFKETKFILQGQYLYKSKEQKWKVAEIGNAQLDAIQHSIFGDGLKLTINGETIEFYGKLDGWFDKLRKQCIQQNFTQKYTIQKLLGQGTYGKVYRAKNKATQIQYAVKTFEKALILTSRDKLCISKELEVARLFEHPNLLKIIETFESEQFIFVVFEFLQGGNLRQQIKRQKVPEKRALQIMRQVLLGLDQMHQSGIIHRDIKPENIMLRYPDNLDELVIADYGLADQYRGDGRYLFVECGTPGYCAPELLAGKIYDYKVDIYSAGIMLYQMLVGEVPFNSDDYNTRVRLNKQGLIDWSIVQVNGITLDFLQSLLARNPFHRMTASQALHHKCYQEHTKNTISNTLVSTGSQLSSPLPSPNKILTSPFASPKIASLCNLDFDELDNLVKEQSLKKSFVTNQPLTLRKEPIQFQSKIQHRSVKSEVLLFFQE